MSDDVKTRSDLLDITRGVLILLVVWGHLLEAKGAGSMLYFAIYAFHIPAFAMISGLVSKSSLDRRAIRDLIQRLLLPLLVFHVLYIMALGHVAPDRIGSVTSPTWLIWFLVSLLTWKLILPLVVRLPYPVFLSVLAALAAGFFDWIGYDFSLSRTFVFFPAFLFGHLYGSQCIALVAQRRMLFGALFVILFCAAFVASSQVHIQWLWGAQGYSAFPTGASSAFFRLIFILLGITMSVAFLALMPSRSRGLSFLGRNTLQVYLLHGFPVMLFWVSGAAEVSHLSFLLLTIILTLVVSFSLANVRINLDPKSASAV